MFVGRLWRHINLNSESCYCKCFFLFSTFSQSKSLWLNWCWRHFEYVVMLNKACDIAKRTMIQRICDCFSRCFCLFIAILVLFLDDLSHLSFLFLSSAEFLRFCSFNYCLRFSGLWSRIGFVGVGYLPPSPKDFTLKGNVSLDGMLDILNNNLTVCYVFAITVQWNFHSLLYAELTYVTRVIVLLVV